MKDDNYTFENFIVSDCNENAYKTCKAFLEEPYGKFVALYGPTATGKTHLLSAISSKYIELYPDNKIEITTYEKFVSEYIEEIKRMNKDDGYNGSFNDKYLKCDLLLIDNMQFIFGKRYTQGEFAKWFLTMLSQRKSVIIAIDRPVDNHKCLIETLQQGVNQCFITELKEPDVAFKRKYLCDLLSKRKCKTS